MKIEKIKKATIISILLIVLGFVFECLHFLTDTLFFTVKFWLLGMVCIIAGVLGLIAFAIIPALNRRAETLGKFKKDAFNNKMNNNVS